MITEQTLFILGAGASHPYGYPTGTELLLDIIKNFPERMEKLVQSVPKGYDVAKQFVDELVKSHDSMIDYFLATSKSSNTSIGKKAILSSIHFYERVSASKDSREIPKDDDWFRYLFREMTKNLTTSKSVEQFNSNRVNFVTFNYDRSLEYLFGISLQNKYSIQPPNVRRYMKGIEIAHIYGRLPELPWENAEIGLTYGRPVNHNYLEQNFEKIKTLHERDDFDKEQVYGLIQDAKRIFFLGFGYADENLALLDLKGNIYGGKKIYGTALGYSENQIEKIQVKICPDMVKVARGSSVYVPKVIKAVTSLELLKDNL